jgi:hypothetical protein
LPGELGKLDSVLECSCPAAAEKAGDLELAGMAPELMATARAVCFSSMSARPTTSCARKTADPR